MATQKIKANSLAARNRIKPVTNALFSVVFAVAALACIVPTIFVIIISFTAQSSINLNGYSFFPTAWSVQAYTALFNSSRAIFMAYGVSIVVTVVGTVLGLALTATMGYVLSRKSFRLRKLYTYIVFIPMIFNGGMVANYVVVAQILGLRGNLWSMILPLLVSSFNVIIMRTFFTTTVPDSLIEAGKIDGASQLRIFLQIVLPISLPALATVGLFLTFAYWNDWLQAMLYMQSNQNLWPMQYTLISIEKNLNFLANNPLVSSMATSEILKNMPSDGVRMAMVVLVVVPIACAYPFFQKYFISGLTIGAVKG